MHLAGFTIEIYYDARPYECQNVVLCCVVRVRVRARRGGWRVGGTPTYVIQTKDTITNNTE